MCITQLDRIATTWELSVTIYYSIVVFLHAYHGINLRTGTHQQLPNNLC